MLFRVLYRFINTKGYIQHYMLLLNEKIAPFEEDYRRFLECIFNLFIFKMNKIKQFILFCLNVILFILNLYVIALNIVLNFIFKKIVIFIKAVINISFFFLSFSNNFRYLFIEFIFMFVDVYILSFKYFIKYYFIEFKYFFANIFGYPEGYEGSFAMEIYPDEYQEYRDSFEKNPGPNLNVYYPMRFALSSVMIRITGVILAGSLILILFFNFINLFIIVDSNFHELRRTLFYRIMEFCQNYIVNYKKYSDDFKYTTATFYSTLKCIILLIYNYIKICLKYLYFDAYFRFGLIETFKIKYYILNFFYNFFVNIFICVLPIHFYYVVYHSYKIIYISTCVNYFFYYLKESLVFFFKIIYIVLKKIYQISYDILTVEEPPIQYSQKHQKSDNENNNNKK